MNDGRIFVCRENFQAPNRLSVRKGTTVREGHELLRLYPNLFVPLVVDYEHEAPKTPPPAPKPPAPVKAAASSPKAEGK